MTRLIDAEDIAFAIEENSIKMNGKQVIEVSCAKALIDFAPTVELFCSYLSDGEVRQPCVESPCNHERPQGKRAGTPLEENDYGYDCVDWIP